MGIDVSTSVVIDARREAVASFAADPENAPRWDENIASVEWETPPPLAVGSRVAFVARFLGRRIAYTYEVRELAASELLVMSTSEGLFPMETTYMWEDDAPGRTRMTLRNRGRPTGVFRFAGPLVARAVRRANRKDLAALEQILVAERS